MKHQQRQSKLTLGEAAKATGISKSTLSRWRRRGVFTAFLQDDGSYVIDASELDRIQNARRRKVKWNSSMKHQMAQSATPNETPELKEDDAQSLRREIEILQKRLEEKEASIQDWKDLHYQERIDKERLLGVVEIQTKLLSPPPEKGFFERLFKRKA